MGIWCNVALKGLVSSALLLFLYANSLSPLPLLESAPWPLSIAAIFSHNLIAAVTVMLCMGLYADLAALPPLNKHCGALRYPRHLSAALAAAIVLSSLLKGMIFARVGLQDALAIILISSPVVVMEWCGLYVAAKSALTKSVGANALLRVALIFFAAAVVEASLIALILRWPPQRSKRPSIVHPPVNYFHRLLSALHCHTSHSNSIGK